MTAAQDLFESALAAEGVSGKLADVARSIYMQESGGGRNTKTSNQGAHGGMQIIPGTFKEVADKDWDINDPEHNARAGIRYLKKLDKRSGGDPALTAAGYYGGPGGMDKARRGVAVSDPKNPKAPNTLQYAAQVVGRLPGKDAPAPVDVLSQEFMAAASPAPQSAPAAASSTASSFVGGVALPPELLAHRSSSPASGGGGAAPANQADAWASFLRAMPQANRPVQVADLSFGAQARPSGPVVPMNIRPPTIGRPAGSAVPNFAAFQAWKGQA